jgi:hypothetical protein
LLPGTEISENSPVGTVVGSLSAVDNDALQTLAFSLSDNGYFTVNGNDVVIGGPIDYELTNLITIEAFATDDGHPALTVSTTRPK